MPVPCSVVAESAGPGVVSTHLAERAQNKEDDQPANKISEQDGGPGKFYGFGGSIKQPCADSAAEGDQLDMAVFQIFAQPVLRVYTVMRTYCIRTLCLRTAFCTRTFRTGSILHKNSLSAASGLVLPYPVLPLGSGKGGTLFHDVDGYTCRRCFGYGTCLCLLAGILFAVWIAILPLVAVLLPALLLDLLAVCLCLGVDRAGNVRHSRFEGLLLIAVFVGGD